MSEESSTADSVQADAPDTTIQFVEVYDCAKNNYDWIKVTNAVANHPDWLTRIPQGRRWTMLHQIVFSGNVAHLNEILAYQIGNDQFRLLFKSSDDKTIRDVALERAHDFPQMVTCVDRLIAADQLLSYAKEHQWDLVRVTVQQHPGVVNTKPPFREFYLIHLLALTGQLNMLIELNSMQHFNLQFLSNGKTADAIARENNHLEFAEHIEQLRLTQMEPDDSADDHSDEPGGQENHFHQPAILLFPSSLTELTDMLQMHTHGFPIAHPPSSVQQEDTVPATCEDDPDDQEEYEQIIKHNTNSFPVGKILDALECPITRCIFRDPVIAADGITYERKAITQWLLISHRSPLTNKDLDSSHLIPNVVLKSIIQALYEGTSLKKASSSIQAT